MGCLQPSHFMNLRSNPSTACQRVLRASLERLECCMNMPRYCVALLILRHDLKALAAQQQDTRHRMVCAKQRWRKRGKGTGCVVQVKQSCEQCIASGLANTCV